MERFKFDEILATLAPSLRNLQGTNKKPIVLLRAGWEEALWRRYKASRDLFKANTAKEKDQYYDRHKVAAIFARVVLDERPLLIQASPTTPLTKKQRLANEFFAYDAAIIILWSFLVDEEENPLVNPRLRDIMIKGGIQYPKCNHGFFRSNLVKAFTHAGKMNTDGFSIFFLAKSLFMLEVTNLSAYKLKLFFGSKTE